MLSGREALGSIDEALRRAHQDAAAIDRDIAGLSERRLRLREEVGQACRELALFRLKQASGGGMISALTSAEERARDIIGKRTEAIRALEGRIAEFETTLADLSRVHGTRLAQVEARRREYAAAEEAVLSRLARMQEWREQAERTEAAERIARHAQEKTRRAEEDRRIKGRPYETDPLFMYLWNCGYGTSDYSGGVLARFFDSRVASLIGFNGARANYAMLLEIPRRLNDHAERWRSRADEETARLEQLEKAALKDSEASGPAQRLAEAERLVAALQKDLDAAEENLARLTAERAEMAAGEDEETRDAINKISVLLQDADIHRLRESARLTPLPEDDLIVERIATLELDIENTERELHNARQRQLEHQRRLRELDDIRREYRQCGYGTAQWDFRDTQMIAMLLGQILGGALSRGGFWEQMKNRRLPDSFPCGWGRRGWRARMPAGRRRGRPPKPPRSAGGGGFRTTGSF